MKKREPGTKMDNRKNSVPKDIIVKYVLKNAWDYQGKVNSKFVLGLILKENPSLKKDVPKVIAEIEEIATEISSCSIPEIKKRLQKIAPEIITAPPKEETTRPCGLLKPLPHAEQGKVAVRIAPSPSGPLHIGHTYGTSLNYEYARMYDGKFIVRIEDTNPENIYPPAYDLIVDDVKWLTDKGISQVIVQSERLGIYYDYAEQLVEQGIAYVCTCDADEWRKLKSEGKACSCRELGVKENQLRYAQMFNEYAEGEAVLRLKTDIKHKNPAMRDFPIMRINEHFHPKTRQEQRVWPLMVFSVAIDDHELGITHVLNGKDHADNAQKEMMIMNSLGWKPPEYKHWGRINFEGFRLSTSETRRAIERKEYSGWEDIRLPFLPSLRRRGYQPEAFRKFALDMGLSLNDKTVSKEEFWKIINSFNKEVIEKKSNRYFFIDQPIEVIIAKAPAEKIVLNLHPDFPTRGTREFIAKGEVHIAESDLKKLGEGKIHRLMDYCNFEIVAGKWKYLSDDYENYKNSEKKGFIIHWLPVEKGLPKVNVMLEDGSIALGLGEKAMLDLKDGDIVQLERRYFARLDKKEGDKLTFYYLHK